MADRVPAPLYQARPDGLLLSVRVTPGASADRIEGVVTRDDGSRNLAIKVRAVPDKGAANKAVCTLVAKAFGLPASSVTLTAGATSRQKRLHLAGDPQPLIEMLNRL